MINIIFMLSFIILGNYIKAQYYQGEEIELSENYDCIFNNDISTNYDINNDGNTNVIDVVHLVEEIIN